MSHDEKEPRSINLKALAISYIEYDTVKRRNYFCTV